MSDITTRTFHLICPGLIHAAGHELVHTLGFASAARDAGFDVQIHHPGAISLPDGDWTSRSWRMPVDNAGLGFAARVKRKSREAMRRAAYAAIFRTLHPNDVAFAHTVGFRDAVLLATAAGQHRLGLLQRFDHFGHEGAIDALKTLARLSATGRTRLFTDSADLAADFEALSGARFDILPPPAPQGVPYLGQPEPVFGFLGGARQQKGFTSLPAIVAAVRAAIPDARFVIQCYSHPDDPDIHAIEQTRETLAGMPGVDLHAEVSDEDRYADLLGRCSILLASYDAHVYRRATSGVFVEALATGRAILTTPNSWMSHEAERWGLERALMVDFSNAQAVADAARQALASLPRPAPNTDTWRKEHAFPVLTTKLLMALGALEDAG